MSKLKSNTNLKPEESTFDFNNLTEQILSHARKSGGIADGNSFVKELVGKTLQALLDAEMEEHLGYAKNQALGNGTGNSRNGRGAKTVKTDCGQIKLNPPRDRNGTFEPEIIKKRSSVTGNFTDKIISLYARGMTTREIADHIREIYQIELSESFVSSAVATVQNEVEQWQARPLDELYTIVYIDGIRFSVRADNGKIIKKCFYTVLGTTVEGQQEVLGMWIADTEGAAFWLSVLTDIKARGVRDILIMCVDGLTGMPDAIESVFPKTITQLCIVHQIRSCCKFVAYKNRKEVCADMKKIYTAPNEKAAKAALDGFNSKWGDKYPAIIASWKAKWGLLVAFLQFPMEMRKITYTTNTIEGLHAIFRKNTKNRRVFPNDESLYRLLYLNIQNLAKKWTKRSNWGIVINQMSILFPDRVNRYIR